MPGRYWPKASSTWAFVVTEKPSSPGQVQKPSAVSYAHRLAGSAGRPSRASAYERDRGGVGVGRQAVAGGDARPAVAALRLASTGPAGRRDPGPAQPAQHPAALEDGDRRPGRAPGRRTAADQRQQEGVRGGPAAAAGRAVSQAAVAAGEAPRPRSRVGPASARPRVQRPRGVGQLRWQRGPAATADRTARSRPGSARRAAARRAGQPAAVAGSSPASRSLIGSTSAGTMMLQRGGVRQGPGVGTRGAACRRARRARAATGASSSGPRPASASRREQRLGGAQRRDQGVPLGWAPRPVRALAASRNAIRWSCPASQGATATSRPVSYTEAVTCPHGRGQPGDQLAGGVGDRVGCGRRVGEHPGGAVTHRAPPRSPTVGRSRR